MLGSVGQVTVRVRNTQNGLQEKHPTEVDPSASGRLMF